MSQLIHRNKKITVRPKERGDCNSMIIGSSEGDSYLSAKHEFHHWHDSLDDIIQMLRDLANSIEEHKEEINEYLKIEK